MPVDKFGRMSDTKTKDTGVSLTYINNNYVRSDGETPLTGSLNMRGNTIYNVADPINPQDVVTKVYVDNTKGSGVIGRKIGDSVSIKENLDFLGKQKIKNLPDPVNDKDAATKEYVDTTTIPFLKLDQTKSNTKGDIDMGGQFTVLNVKTPIDDNHITDKKYVDEMDNLKSAFSLKSGGYEAKGAIFMKKNKLGGLQEPTQDGEATTKKYVDDLVTNQFIDENDNIAFGRDVDMEGNKIFSLPEPDQDSDPATKKYVDDLQNQYIDKRGNIKFGRNINLDNKRIFALKDPKKDYEATNKKYVDDSISKRLQEEKDKFLPKDPATKEYVDEAVKQLAGGDILVSKEGVFIKANGHYRATAPLDIDNHKMENLHEPLEDGDAVNKKYMDGIVEDLTLKQGLIRENGGFNLVDSYINMNFNNIRNVGNPKHEADAVPKKFLDETVKEVEEKIEKNKQIIAVTANYYGKLIKGKFQFSFGGFSLNQYKTEIFNGFLMPHSGYIKKFLVEDFGMKMYHHNVNDDIISLIRREYSFSDPVPYFTLIVFKKEGDIEELGVFYIRFIISSQNPPDISYGYFFYKTLPGKESYKIKKHDILNIRTEVTTTKENENFNVYFFSRYFSARESEDKRSLYIRTNYLDDAFLTYLATVLIELDPLDD